MDALPDNVLLAILRLALEFPILLALVSRRFRHLVPGKLRTSRFAIGTSPQLIEWAVDNGCPSCLVSWGNQAVATGNDGVVHWAAQRAFRPTMCSLGKAAERGHLGTLQYFTLTIINLNASLYLLQQAKNQANVRDWLCARFVSP